MLSSNKISVMHIHIIITGLYMVYAKPNPSPFLFPSDDSAENVASYPVATTTEQPRNHNITTTPMPTKKGNYKIIRGKDGKLKAVLIEGRGNDQSSANNNEPVHRSMQGTFDQQIRGHTSMNVSKSRGGSPLQIDFRNCQDTFCVQVPNYPNEYISQILSNQVSKFNEFFGEDVVISPNISQRFDTGEFEETLCHSSEVLVYPKAAQTKDEQWKLVINEEQYKQGVRVERCLSPNAPCRFADSFGYGYKTECQQRYIYRQLLSLNDQNQLTKDVFKLPSCCKCIIKQINVENRFGGQSPARRKRNANT